MSAASLARHPERISRAECPHDLQRIRQISGTVAMTEVIVTIEIGVGNCTKQVIGAFLYKNYQMN
jgi:hypothetical protein